MHQPVYVEPYDPDWPAAFEAECALLQHEIGPWVLTIEHVGSTAVPGLAAKPIIDIMVGVPGLADGVACVGPLQGLAYVYVPEFEGLIPDRLYFRKDTGGRRSHQIHLVEWQGDFWERHIRFRDYLCRHRQRAEAYADLKYRLAEQYRHDRLGYTDAKSDFIQETLRLAGTEGAAAAQGPPSPQVTFGSGGP